MSPAAWPKLGWAGFPWMPRMCAEPRSCAQPSFDQNVIIDRYQFFDGAGNVGPLVRRRFSLPGNGFALAQVRNRALWGLVAGPCNQVALKKMKGC